MDNTFCILMAGMLFTMTACFLVYIIGRHRESAHAKRHIAFFCVILLWNALGIAYYSAKSEKLLLYIYEARLTVLALVFAMLFLLAAAFYRPEGRLPRWVIALLFAFPAATAGFSVATLHTEIITAEFRVLSFTPLTQVSVRWGVWFYIMAVYICVIIPLIAAMIIIRYRNRPKAYNSESRLIALSFFLFAFGAAIEGFFPSQSLISYLMLAAGGIFLYMYIDLSGKAGFLKIERADVFNYLDSAVLLLGPDGSIVDMNTAGRALMDSFDEDGEGQILEEFIAGLLSAGKIIRASPNSQDGGTSVDIYIPSANYPLIYRMYRQEVPRTGRTPAWAFASFEDVTRNQLFIERLQNIAGVDVLTGLYNRYGYTELLRKIDLPENLPVSIIVGDVNGLKMVNDTYGHAAGDRFLISIASALKSCCDQNCYAARIGGDEFVILARHCDEKQGAALRDRLYAAVDAIEGLEQKPSIALGCATKSAAEENINSLLNRADKLMYSDKK